MRTLLYKKDNKQRGSANFIAEIPMIDSYIIYTTKLNLIFDKLLFSA